MKTLYMQTKSSKHQEPVIYVAGRPHVLRLVDRPLENVEYVDLSSKFVPV